MQVVPQQQVTVETGEVVQHRKMVPGTTTPDIGIDIFIIIGQQRGRHPGHQEPTFATLTGLLNPGREDGQIEIEADQ